MAFPSDIEVGQGVQYLPGVFDLFAFNSGLPGAVAAIITAIDPINETVSLYVIPDQKTPFFRPEIKYYTEATGNENGFKKTSDPAIVPTCTDEVVSLGVSDYTNNSFLVSWEDATNTVGTVVEYRETLIGGAWLTPNLAGNKTGDYVTGGYQFNDFVTGTEYDIRVRNRCTNLAISAGVTTSGVAVDPL